LWLVKMCCAMRLIKSLPNSIDIIHRTDKFMSKIEELIQQLCPNGVEYKPLNSLGNFYCGLTGKNKEDFISGNAKFITYKNIYSNIALNINTDERVKIEEKEQQNTIEYGDVLFTGSSETPDECGFSSVLTTKTDEKLYLNSFCFGFRLFDKNLFLPDFLKHIFRSQSLRYQIGKTASGVTRFNVSKKLMGKIIIPVPPLPVQEEIVRILDNFTNLTAELQAELQARKSQYEYYRDELLNYNVSKRIPLKNISNGVCSGKSKERIHNGKFPLYGSTGIISSTNTAEYHKEQILIARVGANAGYVYIAKGDYDVSDNTLIVDIKPDFSLKYIFYQLSGMNLHQYAKGGGQPLVTAGQIKEIIIPIPPLAEQDRIVKILDRFDALVNDLSVGLPAEIAARQKQYEYYRDMLLSFNELPNE